MMDGFVIISDEPIACWKLAGFSNAVGQSKKRLCCSDFVELPLHSKVGAIEVFHYGDEDAGQGEDSFSSPSAWVRYSEM